MIEWLLAAIEEKDFVFVKKMVTEDYATVLKRDQVLEDKLDKVCQRAFNESLKPPNAMQQMMAQMMGGGKK